MGRKYILMVLAALFFSSVVVGGNLEPSGPPAATMKPLDQLEPRIPITSVPFEITTSGSYYLTGNLTSSDSGITVDANDVTIDLSGFTLKGTASYTYHGIQITNQKNVEIRNGTVRGFTGYGIYEDSSNGRGHRILAVRCMTNVYGGINLVSKNNVITECIVSENGSNPSLNGSGIQTGDGSTVRNNSVFNNAVGTYGAVGISAGIGSAICDNAVFGNGKNSLYSVYGIIGGSGCTISGNTVYDNGSGCTADATGLCANQNSTVIKNVVYSNGNYAAGPIYGMRVYHNSTVIGNSVTGSGSGSSGTKYGIWLGGSNLVDQNVSSNNGTNIYSQSPTTVIYGQNVQ